MDNPQSNKDILALDIGDKRIGVARASAVARLPEPVTTLINDASLQNKLTELIKQYDAELLVIGLPRGMSGQTTQQTHKVRQVMAELKRKLVIKVVWQDETLTSVQAEQELKNRGVRYNKEAIDALAATLILEDFLRAQRPT